jgi:hypothetical protein
VKDEHRTDDGHQRAVPAGREPWYAEGLRFGCTRCGHCCGGPPGFVWVGKEEIEHLAGFMRVEAAAFLTLYCRSVWWRTSLRELDNGDCVFLTPQGCSVYPVRPVQCRTFPFWPDSLRSPQGWEALKERCPGVGQGRLYALDEIEQVVSGRGATG